MDKTTDFKKANEYTLKCMLVTMIVMILCWVLNILHIFILDQSIMNHSLFGLTAFIAVGYLVKYTIGLEKPVSNYLMLFFFVGMLSYANAQLAYHGTIFMLFPMVCSILYNYNRYIRYTFVLTCLGFLFSVLVGFRIGLCDANMLILTTSTTANETIRLLTESYEINSDMMALVLFYVVPRCMGLVAFTSVLKYLKNSVQEKTLHEQEIMQVAETERLANQAKSRFLAQMSHEIRTPINAVLGMNEMILHKAKEEEILEYSGNIKKAGKTLLVLINSILDFSKIEDGKMEILPVKYYVADLIDNLRISVEQRAKDKGLELIINSDKDLPSELFGDDMRISQVIINLLTNAVKYTKQGSVTLDIKASSREGDNITLLVSVTDTGIGIREEDLPKLFNSFERLEEKRNRTIEGTGLGLAITTKLLDMMGSKLEVKSTYGKGSTFYFYLSQHIVDDTPVGDQAVAPSKTQEISESSSSECSYPDAKVLVVDDNDMNLKVIRNLLGLFRITPTLESSGSAAIENMKHNEYDVVFMDHMMPEMDGIETLAKLREENLVPANTRMIALTANAIVGAKKVYLDASFDDYLTKPIEMDQLFAILDRYIPDEKKIRSAKAGTEDDEDEILEFAPDDASDEADESNVSAIIEGVKNAGLDTDAGLKYCANDQDFYVEMLNDFAEGCSDKEKTLTGCYEKEDWKDYKIYVHAIKTNLRSIGAADISELARTLENAADIGDIATIRQKHAQLVSEYTSVASKIKKILQDNR
ncbi:MAG: response regulator [Lachnospiraceae bacterium]|nr:response regulator [Lachnospiraceae bacterium]